MQLTVQIKFRRKFKAVIVSMLIDVKAFSLWGKEYRTSYCLLHKAAFTTDHLPGLCYIIHCWITGNMELKGKERNG